eukprot:1560947-Rhodomonas_salina.1
MTISGSPPYMSPEMMEGKQLFIRVCPLPYPLPSLSRSLFFTNYPSSPVPLPVREEREGGEEDGPAPEDMLNNSGRPRAGEP